MIHIRRTLLPPALISMALFAAPIAVLPAAGANPDPQVTVDYTMRAISGSWWGSAVSVSVYADETATTPLVTYPSPTVTSGNFNLGNNLTDVQAGRVVTATGDVDGTAWTKSVTVFAMGVDQIDLAADTLGGYAPPGKSLTVQVYGTPWEHNQQVTADGSGSWSASFAGVEDLTMQSGGGLLTWDAEGDMMTANWHAPMLNLNYDLRGGRLNGCGWGTPWVTGDVALSTSTDGSTWTPLVTVTPDQANNGCFNWPSQPQAQGLDLAVGSYVKAVAGDWTKTLQIAPLRVVSVDPANDLVTGTGPVGATVQVNKWTMGGPPGTPVTAVVNALGHWVVSLPIDPGEGGNSWVNDADGDMTTYSFGAPTPMMQAWLGPNPTAVNGGGWQPATTVTVHVSSSYGDSTGTATSDQNGNFGYALPDGAQLHVGDVVTASMQIGTPPVTLTVTRALTLADIGVDAIDIATNTVSGHAPAGVASVYVAGGCGQGNGENHPNVPVTSGQWQVTFALDLTFGCGVMVTLADNDGDNTVAQLGVPSPSFAVDLRSSSIVFWGWQTPYVTSVTVSRSTDGGATWTELGTANTSGDGWFNWTPPAGVAFPTTGDVVKVDGGNGMVKQTVVKQLRVLTADFTTDVVTGFATPGATVQVGPYNNSPEPVFVDVTADGDGRWSADLSGVGGFGSDSGGYAWILDDDGDRTSFDWESPAPTLQANANGDTVYGQLWPAGAIVDFTVQHGTSSLTGSATATSSGWDYGSVEWLLPGGTALDAGDTITAQATVNGVTVTRSLTLAALTIDTADVDSNTITGTAPAGTTVHINVWTPNVDEPESATVEATGGQWSYQTELDLTVDNEIDAWLPDEDGDRTSAYATGGQQSDLWVETVYGPTTDGYVATGRQATFEAEFGDDTPGDTYTVTWTWGDGGTSTGTVVTQPGEDTNGLVRGTHTFTTVGKYVVEVSVSQNGGPAVGTWHGAMALVVNLKAAATVKGTAVVHAEGGSLYDTAFTGGDVQLNVNVKRAVRAAATTGTLTVAVPGMFGGVGMTFTAQSLDALWTMSSGSLGGTEAMQIAHGVVHTTKAGVADRQATAYVHVVDRKKGADLVRIVIVDDAEGFPILHTAGDQAGEWDAYQIDPAYDAVSSGAVTIR